MTIFSEFGFRESRGPLENAQGFALEQLVSIQCVTTDLRWAMVELAWRSFTAMWAFAQGRLVSWVRKARAPRAEEGSRRHCCC
jgi:hypothetical protein